MSYDELWTSRCESTLRVVVLNNVIGIVLVQVNGNHVLLQFQSSIFVQIKFHDVIRNPLAGQECTVLYTRTPVQTDTIRRMR